MSDGRTQFVVEDQARAEAFVDVSDEMDEQIVMFGKQDHDPAYWLAILGKQVGQLGEAILNYKWANTHNEMIVENKRNHMYEECRQIAGVAVSMMVAMREGDLRDEVTSAKPKDKRKLARALGRGDDMIDYDMGGEG